MRPNAFFAPLIASLLLASGCQGESGPAEASGEGDPAPATAADSAQPDGATADSASAPADATGETAMPGAPAADATPAAVTAPAAAVAAAPAKPPAAFMQCRSCHAVEPGKNGIGPSLHGVVGAKAASVEGFRYSPALTESGLSWDRATLDKWLSGPMQLVPGTRMVIPVRDAEQRKAIIDYLATLK